VILEFWGESAEIAPYFERDLQGNLWKYRLWRRRRQPPTSAGRASTVRLRNLKTIVFTPKARIMHLFTGR